MPTVNEKFATEPVPPVFPHAPQVSQLGESSTSLRTVALEGVAEGVGEGEAAGVGVGDGDGAGLGVGDALAMGAPVLVEAGFPPQPLTASKTTGTTKHRIQLRTVTPPEFGPETRAWTVLRELRIWITRKTRS